jgi:hypothetical protein
MTNANRILGTGVAAICLIPTPEAAGAATFLYKSVGQIGEYLAYDNAKPVIADNGTIAYLNIREFVTDERITAIDNQGTVTVLLDSDDPVTPLNVVGPGISDDGQHVAYMAREQVPGDFPIDRIYRQSASGSPAVLIAEQPGDSIGAASCRGSCDVTNTGSVVFSTLNPTTLSY